MTPEIRALLSKIQGTDPESVAMLTQFAQAVQGEPFRKGIMNGMTANFFTQLDYTGETTIELALDPLVPGTEKEFVGFTVPGCGYLPQRNIEPDVTHINTYYVANTLDWCIHTEKNSRFNLFDRYMQIFQDGISTKISNDAWHLVLAAGVSRGIIAFDSLATTGYFTKRLVSMMKVVMRRNGGGNSGSMNRSRLTDLFLSPEALEGMRNWGVDQADDFTRREIYTAGDDVSRVFGVNLHPLDELGVGKEYQDYYTTDLSGPLPGTKQEIVVGLDLSMADSFLMPVSEPLMVMPRTDLLPQFRAGLVGRTRFGLAVLDSRRVLLGAL